MTIMHHLDEATIMACAAGTLDDPVAFEPTMTVFEHQAPAWARLPTYPRAK